MGAKHFGARVARLEDPALLTGRGQFVDDINLPGALHAAFVRSPHAHARIRGHRQRGGARHAGRPRRAHRRRHAARASPPARSRCWCPIPAIKTPRTQIALARDEVCYVGQTIAVVVADSRHLAEDAAAAVDDRLRAAAGGERLPRCGEARRAARAQPISHQHRGLRADELRRRRGRVQERAARVRGGDAPASRRGDDARRPRRAGELRCRPPTCSRSGRRRRRRISAAARSPTCSSAIWN